MTRRRRLPPAHNFSIKNLELVSPNNRCLRCTYCTKTMVDHTFDMEGLHDALPFDMEDDYGFYDDLEDDTYRCESSEDEDDTHHVAIKPSDRIEDEQDESLSSSPPILSPSIVESLAEDGLPWSMQDMKWSRLYASSRDGACFGTFLRKVRGKQTIIVAKTSDGKIVGAFATDPWSGRKAGDVNAHHGFLFSVSSTSSSAANTGGVNKKKMSPLAQPSSSQSSFGAYIPGLGEFGTSPTSAFDFNFATQLSASSKRNQSEQQQQQKVDIFKPQPGSGFKQTCQLGNKFISLCDGVKSLSIENSFTRGRTTTGASATEQFDVVEFEVYGFTEG